MPNLFLASVPFAISITNNIKPPINGISDNNTSHPVLFRSCNLLIETHILGIKVIKIATNEREELFTS